MGRAWMVDYDYEATAVRLQGGREVELEREPGAGGPDLDLVAGDEELLVKVRAEPGTIRVGLLNRSTETVTLELDAASFVDSIGSAHGLFSRGEAALPTALEVAPGSSAGLALWPRHLAREGRDGPGAWRGDSPLGGSTISTASADRALAARRGDVGRGFEIRLPLRVGRNPTEVRLRFTVIALRALPTIWA